MSTEQNYQESALTAPSDRNPDRSYIKQLNGGVPPLTQEESLVAMASLNKDKYPNLSFNRVERRYADKPLSLQTFGLISFVPAKGATPNEAGLYGFAKLRGNFASQRECNERAEEIIRTEDSYHTIYHTHVGRPFPLSSNPDYVEETVEINIRKDMTESISENIKKKKNDEQKTIDEIQARETNLLEDVKKEDEDPLEHYTVLRTKKAQLTWTYIKTLEKLEELKKFIIKAHLEIKELDTTNPEFSTQFYDKYVQARKATGISVDEKDDNFIKYMVEDIKLDFLE